MGLGPFLRWHRLDRANKLVLVEGLITLAAASAAIKLLPFSRIAAAAGAARPQGSAERGDHADIDRCHWAVRTWSRIVPWRTVCFQQGLTLHFMLRRRGVTSVLHYGVAQLPNKGLSAHVWVSVEGENVIGGEEAAGHTLLASFPAHAEARPLSARGG